MSSSVGMMTFPIYGKKHVPNHQKHDPIFPKPSSNQQFTSSLPRSSTGPPTAFAIQSGLQIRLWTAGMTTPSFSNVLSSAQPLRSYSASPQSQDPRIWTQLDSAGFSFTSCPMVPRTKGRMSRTSPSQKKGHFSRDHMR